MAIRTFKDKRTELLADGGFPRGVPSDVADRAWAKLERLNAARDPTDLKVPPGNRLERLRGDRQGQWSIRVNDQWRICFRWNDHGAWDVEFCDYH